MHMLLCCYVAPVAMLLEVRTCSPRKRFREDGDSEKTVLLSRFPVLEERMGLFGFVRVSKADFGDDRLFVRGTTLHYPAYFICANRECLYERPYECPR